MKNYYLLVLLVLFFKSTLIAQFGPQQVITTNANGAKESIPCDLNGDGYIDVVSLSYEDGEIKWYKNIDGLGNFSSENIIFQELVYNLDFQVADIDSDNDEDLLLLYNNPRRLVWWENIDGEGNFEEQEVLLENQPNFIQSFNPIDIDNDNDLDIIVKYTNTFFDWVVCYESINGEINFNEEILLIDELMGANTIQIVDIDNDNVLDILTSNERFTDAARLVWYKNLGEFNFGEEQVIYQFSFFQSDWTSIISIQYVDINTDEKKDIIISTHNDDVGSFKFWFENIDNQGGFEEIEVVSYPVYLPFYDLDDDGDMDMLAVNNSSIIWYENVDSLGDFVISTISTDVETPWDAQAADFNGDGLLDVVSASYDDDKIAWYENGVLGIDEIVDLQVNLYPNPSKGIINLKINKPIKTLKVFNVIGELLLEQENTSNQIDISILSSGLLFLHIETDEGVLVKKVIKE